MMNTHANASTTASITFEGLASLMDEIKASMPPMPTEDQKRFAAMLGFPGYPGFKVGPVAWDKLKGEGTAYLASEGYPAGDAFRDWSAMQLYGVPIAVDETLPPDAIMSVQAIWEATDRMRAEMLFAPLPMVTSP